MSKNKPKVTRTLTVTMDATAANARVVWEMVEKITGGDNLTFTLSENPQVGEVWKDGNGNEYELCKNIGGCSNFTLRTLRGNTTFRENGMYSGSQLSLNNLAERVEQLPVIEIKDGEYWMDGEDNIWKVRVSPDTTQLYRVTSMDGAGARLTWTLRGNYYSDSGAFNTKNLVKKMVFADDCTNKGD